MKISRQQLLLFLRLSRPHFLLGGFLLYALGVSIAAYLGKPMSTPVYLFGQGIVTSIQLMVHYLHAYYDAAEPELNSTQSPAPDGADSPGPGSLPRGTGLYAGIAAMTLAATFTGMLLVRNVTSPVAWLILLLIFFGAFAYSAPPLRLVHSGYGELIASFIIAGLLPSFAFILQTGKLHRLIIMTTIPIIALHFAMMIVLELPDYATDVKYEKQTLMVRVGWQTAMRMHDAAIVFAGLAFFAAYLSGLPWRVTLGTLIAVPLGIAQIWQMNRIKRGLAPNWRMLTLSAFLLFSLTTYLEWMGYLFS